MEVCALQALHGVYTHRAQLAGAVQHSADALAGLWPVQTSVFLLFQEAHDSE